ncbi:SGNH/GDSL hydrolase family protein [Rubellimicrobium arenae]|uniref:SGNH/GDSL hydrolase family protein n=1 Tax=Rubellimicrobium arenae TaxID=2817372 RepID=UPI001B318472|nr:SGNH/GDSL hydrolase family protein [Rubellimicrobium arenae]
MTRRALSPAILAVALAPLAAPQASAATFDTVYIFGDSFSDTGAGFPLTNGDTAASYLAERIGSELSLPDDPNPGTNSINFAESGARVGVETAGGPKSLTNQVRNLVQLVSEGAASFDPSDTLFFLSGGLNDHELSPAEDVVAAYAAQVQDLVAVGAKYIQIALLPREVPAFTDSADFLNPAYRDLVPKLAALYPDVNIGLSDWGTYYDDILLNPDRYGITNTTDPCLPWMDPDGVVCENPEEYFYYWIVHPSDAAHRIVGEQLYRDTLAIEPSPIPLPASLSLLGMGVLALGGVRRAKAKRQGRYDLQLPTEGEGACRSPGDAE